jgi:hypothetical protein
MQIEIYLYLFNNYKINLDFQGMTKYVFSYIICQIKNNVAIFTKMGIYGGDNRVRSIQICAGRVNLIFLEEIELSQIRVGSIYILTFFIS